MFNNHKIANVLVAAVAALLLSAVSVSAAVGPIPGTPAAALIA